MNKVIDGHLHVYPPEINCLILNTCLRPSGRATDLVLQEAKVSQALALPLPDTSLLSTYQANSYVLEESKKYSSLIPIACIDNEIEHWLSLGVKGFKEHVWMQRRLWENGQKGTQANIQKWAPQYQAIEAAKVPLIIHLGPNPVSQVKSILEVAPDIILILAHCGWAFIAGERPPVDWDITIQPLKIYENIYFDLANFYTDSERVLLRNFIQIFGAQKIIWGSDYPQDSILPGTSLSWIDSARLSSGAFEEITYSNIKRILCMY